MAFQAGGGHAWGEKQTGSGLQDERDKQEAQTTAGFTYDTEGLEHYSAVKKSLTILPGERHSQTCV